MKDIIDEFQTLIDSYKTFEDRPYSLREILKDFPGHQHRVMEKLYQRFNANPYGYCFPILVEHSEAQSGELHLYTLIDVMTLDSYPRVIPDNKFSYSCELTKMRKTDFKETLEVEIVNTKVLVEVKLHKISFKTSLVEAVKFPDDYFLKGIPLLTEKLSQQFITDHSAEKSYKNEHFPLIKKLTEKKIIEDEIS